MEIQLNDTNKAEIFAAMFQHIKNTPILNLIQNL
jgi:hypothetical protein